MLLTIKNTNAEVPAVVFDDPQIVEILDNRLKFVPKNNAGVPISQIIVNLVTYFKLRAHNVRDNVIMVQLDGGIEVKINY